jgi:hypothetical protein
MLRRRASELTSAITSLGEAIATTGALSSRGRAVCAGCEDAPAAGEIASDVWLTHGHSDGPAHCGLAAPKFSSDAGPSSPSIPHAVGQ